MAWIAPSVIAPVMFAAAAWLTRAQRLRVVGGLTAAIAFAAANVLWDAKDQGFHPTALRRALLVLQFPSDEYYCVATCCLTTTTGKELQMTSTATG